MVETANARVDYNVIQWQVDQYRKRYQAAYDAIIASGYVIVQPNLLQGFFNDLASKQAIDNDLNAIVGAGIDGMYEP
jgi:hypothetical protein